MICYCWKLRCFPEERLHPSLSYLYVSKCPLLEPRLQRRVGEDWDKISHIPRIYISERRIWRPSILHSPSFSKVINLSLHQPKEHAMSFQFLLLYRNGIFIWASESCLHFYCGIFKILIWRLSGWKFCAQDFLGKYWVLNFPFSYPGSVLNAVISVVKRKTYLPWNLVKILLCSCFSIWHYRSVLYTFWHQFYFLVFDVLLL